MFWLVLKHGGILTTVGGVLGLVVAYLAGRAASGALYEVHASDPIILGAAAVVVVSIALLATLIPAYRSARLDPGHVLRPE
jgi:ABC-type antimicrobial peptide transport system permease subunit